MVKRNSEHGFELVLDKKSTNLVEPDTLGLQLPKKVQTKAWLRDCLPRLVRAMEQLSRILMLDLQLEFHTTGFETKFDPHVSSI